MVGHFLNLQWNKDFRKNQNVLDKSCPQCTSHPAPSRKASSCTPKTQNRFTIPLVLFYQKVRKKLFLQTKRFWKVLCCVCWLFASLAERNFETVQLVMHYIYPVRRIHTFSSVYSKCIIPRYRISKAKKVEISFQYDT